VLANKLAIRQVHVSQKQLVVDALQMADKNVISLDGDV